MNKPFRSLRYIVLVLSLFTCVNTEPLSSVPAVAGIQGKSASPSPVSGSITRDDRQIKVEYIAHACFRIYSPHGKRIIIDPYGSQIWLGRCALDMTKKDLCGTWL